MKTSRRRIYTAAILILVFSIATACSNRHDPGQKSAESNSPSSVTPAASDKVTLRFSWFGAQDRHKVTLAAIDKYEKLHPNVKIEAQYGVQDGYYDKLITQLASGTAPDLTPLVVAWVDDLAVKGNYFLDLNTLKDDLNLKEFDSGFLDQYATFNGKLAGLPMGANGVVSFYNKDFFAKYQIPESTNWDWDTLLKVGKQVHQQDSSAYLVTKMDYFFFLQPFVNQLSGNNFIKDDNTIGFTRDELLKALTYYKEAMQAGVVQPLSESSLYKDVSENQQWLNGQIGIHFEYISLTARLKSGLKNIDVTTFPIPNGAKQTGVAVNAATLLSITKTSEHPKEAAAFMNWLLTSDDAALILKDNRSVPAVPSTRNLLTEQKLIDPTVSKGIELAVGHAGKPINGISGNQEITQMSNDILEQVGFDKLSPEKATDQLMKRIQDKLSSLK